MTCEMCGKHDHQETIKHKGLTVRVCRQCGNTIREERRPKQAKARRARQEQAQAARTAPPVAVEEPDDDLPPPVEGEEDGEATAV